MTPEELLALAKRLLRARTEAAWRSSISRAYYGAFLTWRAVAQAEGAGLGRSRNLHQLVGEWAATRDQEAADGLAQLRVRRNEADYDLEVDVTRNMPRLAVEVAERLAARAEEGRARG